MNNIQRATEIQLFRWMELIIIKIIPHYSSCVIDSERTLHFQTNFFSSNRSNSWNARRRNENIRKSILIFSYSKDFLEELHFNKNLDNLRWKWINLPNSVGINTNITTKVRTWIGSYISSLAIVVDWTVNAETRGRMILFRRYEMTSLCGLENTWEFRKQKMKQEKSDFFFVYFWSNDFCVTSLKIQFIISIDMSIRCY